MKSHSILRSGLLYRSIHMLSHDVNMLNPAQLSLKPRPNALNFSLYIARQMSSIVECCREGVAKRSRVFTRFGTQHSRDVLFDVHYLMTNCACVRSTTLDNFALDQTSLDKKQSSRFHSTRWPNALDISLNMHVERCIVKSRERLTRALENALRQGAHLSFHINRASNSSCKDT